nr:sigma-70 family RNA polymerase sigma factor [Clostridia bacterium]
MYQKNEADYSQNNELLKRIKEGDDKALDELVKRNMGLVKSIVTRFGDRGCDYEDLLQIGTIGMIKAARSFDFGYNTVFSTYAVPLIIGEIRRFLRDDGAVKVSRTLKRDGMTVMKCREEYIRIHGCEPRLEELAQLSGLDIENVTMALEAATPITSLSEPVGDDGMTLDGVISDNDNAIDSLTDRIALSEAINELPGLWRQIITLRYFKELSQQQTGALLGLTQVKVSREEKKILEKLRRSL